MQIFSVATWKPVGLAAACFLIGHVAEGAGAAERRWEPGPETTWHWQLQGKVDPTLPVDIYDLDLFDTGAETIAGLRARGVRVLCYFSAGSAEDWRPDFSAFRQEEMGKALDGWKGERWLDVRSGNVRAVIAARIELAARKGCDGVEPDNVDGFLPENRSGFDFTAADQLAFNRFLAATAHELGLAVALKNDVDQIGELAGDFDLALNEQCHEHEECGAYAAFTQRGKPVLNAEYAARFHDEATRGELCAAASRESVRTLVLPLKLDGSFRLACP